MPIRFFSAPIARLAALLLTAAAPLAVSTAGPAGASAPIDGTTVLDAPQPGTGVITGRVGAVDPDGDPLTFTAPPDTGNGTVAMAPDGAFVYTPAVPGAPDMFTATAHDPAGELLDVPVSLGVVPPTRGVGFNFVYGPGAELWTPEARAALEAGAAALSAYLVVPQPVTIDVGVVGVNNPGATNIASSWVGFTDPGPGFTGTWLQTKLQDGIDPNGADPDVQLTVNFAENWGFGAEVGPDRYDFRTVVMHELVHALGFLSGADDTIGQDRNWTIYDSFLRAPDGNPVIDDAHEVKPQYLPNFTGADGGLFFDGPNAVAAFGGPIPVFTPEQWASASRSVSHIGARRGFLMVPFYGYGSGTRTLTPVEQAMLRDLGYTVVAP